MSTIDEKVYALLLEDAGVTALVPRSNIKSGGDYQGIPRPYIVHFPATVAPIYCHDGLASLTPWPNYQVSSFAETYRQARDIADAVVTALTGVHSSVHYFWRNRVYQYETGTGIHHIADDFEVFE